MSDEDTQQILEYSDEVSEDEQFLYEVVAGKRNVDFSQGGCRETQAALETTQRLPRKWKKSAIVTEKTNSPPPSVGPGEVPVDDPVLKKPAATSVRKKRAAARAEARSTNDLMECYTQRAAKSQKKTVKPPSGASSSDGKDRSGAV